MGDLVNLGVRRAERDTDLVLARLDVVRRYIASLPANDELDAAAAELVGATIELEEIALLVLANAAVMDADFRRLAGLEPAPIDTSKPRKAPEDSRALRNPTEDMPLFGTSPAA